MKLLSIASLITLILSVSAPAFGQDTGKVRMDHFGDGYQLIYFGVLEGLFRDGVTSKDVDQILLRSKEGTSYDHFIYACPICNATIHALEFYRKRPRFYGLKDHSPPAKFRTFGKGLSKEIRANLRDADSGVRLTAIHDLVSGWVNDRFQSLKLTDEERQQLRAELEAGRNQGMEMLEKWQKDPKDLAFYAPAYANLEECAVCNAALQMDFKTENKKP